MNEEKILLIPNRKAHALLPKVCKEGSRCIYLSNDYERLVSLESKLNKQVKIENLSGLFEKIFSENKQMILDKYLDINEQLNSFEWWGNQMASKSTPASPFILNVVYLFCAKSIMREQQGPILFITDSPALAQSIAECGVQLNKTIQNYHSKMDAIGTRLKLAVYYVIQIGAFVWTCIKNRRDAFRVLKPLTRQRTSAQKRIVIRSWVTDNNFDKNGIFRDRNFGKLTEWLGSRGYEVWTLPLFFNLKIKTKDMYEAMARTQKPFLLPDHYLRPTDYWEALWTSYKGFSRSVKNIDMHGIDISPIFNEAMKRLGFNVGLTLLNLCVPALKRLKEAGFQIDGFYYPFECNAPENQFILGCRRYYPDSEIIGFQHTTFFPNQLAYHLTKDEDKIHPLPDKIVCSGPVYKDLHKKAGFPQEILEDGPNLRFDSVYSDRYKNMNHQGLESDKKILLLPLTFSYSLAFELFLKVNNALNDSKEYVVYIRNHPLLSKKLLINFLKKINMNSYKFADNGIIQEWLSKTHAVVTTGGTIIILEAVTSGTPVIRVIPDNTFYYDPFTWPDYPLNPVNTFLEVRQQLQKIDEICNNGASVFSSISEEVLKNYFTKPSKENMKVFL